MKVADLRRILAHPHLKDDDDVVIHIVSPNTTVGGSPVIPVKSANSGFDWDHGKLMIRPETDVRPVDEAFLETKKYYRKLSETLGWLYLQLGSRSLDHKAKVRLMRQTLRDAGLLTGSLCGTDDTD